MRSKGPGEICVYLLLSTYTRNYTQAHAHTHTHPHTLNYIYTRMSRKR